YDGGTETENKGFDGDAVATGGNGGKGGECCTPPAASGGSGGAGGDAVATAGMNGGTAIANGGSGGAGGDGCGPGGGGNGGGASATGESEVENPGPNGAPGAWCVPPPEEYYIWFDDIVPGPISEGVQTLPVYDNPTGTGTPVGEVSVFFGGPLNKQPTGGIQMQAGAIIGVDCKTFVKFGPPDLIWPNFKVNSAVADIINGTDFPQCFILRGFYDTNLIDEALCQNPGGIGSPETVMIDVAGSSFTDTFDILEMNATAAILLQPALCFQISPDC
ncbi:MAG: hypothetical protein CL946_12405, partial [Ectothiorhodospiraceae bacterium]|nr:hypothetical protein [Ectothiorhodospiraceae bacterium]